MNDFRLEVRLRKLFVLDFLGDYIVSIHFILTMVSILLLFRRIVYICRNAVSAIVLSQPFAFTLCYQNVNSIVLDIISCTIELAVTTIFEFSQPNSYSRRTGLSHIHRHGTPRVC